MEPSASVGAVLCSPAQSATRLDGGISDAQPIGAHVRVGHSLPPFPVGSRRTLKLAPQSAAGSFSRVFAVRLAHLGRRLWIGWPSPARPETFQPLYPSYLRGLAGRKKMPRLLDPRHAQVTVIWVITQKNRISHSVSDFTLAGGKHLRNSMKNTTCENRSWHTGSCSLYAPFLHPARNQGLLSQPFDAGVLPGTAGIWPLKR